MVVIHKVMDRMWCAKRRGLFSGRDGEINHVEMDFAKLH